MKALIYNSNTNEKIELIEKEIPAIKHPKDAILKVKLSAICTSDLHIKNGFVPLAKNKTILGHEFVGEVIAIGDEVKDLKIGDRVCANCETFCGECYFCKRGYINNCEIGGWELGCKIDGGQAEFVRVPYSDNGLTKLPDNVSYENALFVGDILSSGYFGAEMCEIQQHDTIAVIGCGPVGLCAMICAKIFGAERIIAIDIDENRLKLAQKQGLADFIFNPNTCNIEKEIKSLTLNRGVDGVIECAGTKESFEMSWKIARPNSIVGIVAMYEEDLKLPLPKMYGKNLTFKTGGVDAVHCEKLVKLISEGKISTDFLITHTYKLENILEAYKFFEQKPQGCLKIAIEC
ncbi:alcohol dehydrogenase catalytic domain-containing protein [bacterium]|nr:alcohol dehydrogenase catalytic domain-containing protein [bacterium]